MTSLHAKKAPSPEPTKKGGGKRKCIRPVFAGPGEDEDEEDTGDAPPAS